MQKRFGRSSEAGRRKANLSLRSCRCVFFGLVRVGERAVCRSVSNGAGEVRTAAFSRKGRARRRPFPSEGLRGVGRFGRMRSVGAVRAVGAGGDTDRSEKRCCVQPLRPAGKVDARRMVLPVRGAGNKDVVSLRRAGEAGEIRFCIVLRPGAECRNPLSSGAEASAVVELGTNPSRRIGGSCFLRGRVRAKRMFLFVTDAHRRMVGLAMRRQPIGCRRRCL